MAGRHERYDVEYRVRRSDGVYRWFKTRGVPIRNGEGGIFKWFGTCTDITDGKKIEEALRESEERFRGTFENAAVGIAHVAINGRFLRVNEKLCDILGYMREELLARKFQDITFPDDLNADLEQLALLLRGELPSSSRDDKPLPPKRRLDRMGGRFRFTTARCGRRTSVHHFGYPGHLAP